MGLPYPEFDVEGKLSSAWVTVPCDVCLTSGYISSIFAVYFMVVKKLKQSLSIRRSSGFPD